MKYIAEIEIMPRPEIPDPQGENITRTLKRIAVEGVGKVRVGKHLNLTLEAASEEEAREKVTAACEKLLANDLVETYSFFLYLDETQSESTFEAPVFEEEE